ncbi:fish-egg lectin-like [Alosa pseudoharengus]|uniref:fish-egg lectin-like n=1 Tax=Alosa pseudoharengus TaxID=34774 RepID=UPI003F8CDF97
MSLRIATILFALHCLLTACNAYTCEVIPGSLVQIDVGNGQVMGVNKEDNIFTLYESTWTQINGKLKHVTVGQAGIWGVNCANNIFKLAAGSWVQVPGLLKQIDAGGDQFVAGCNHDDVPFCLTVGYMGANGPVSWTSYPGKLKYYSCGPYSCWGINSEDQIFIRKGVDSLHCQGVGDWQHIAGSLSMIEVGGDGSVYGVNSAGNVFRRDSTSPCKPEGDEWTQINIHNGQVKHVSYDMDHLWIILKDDAIYNCKV